MNDIGVMSDSNGVGDSNGLGESSVTGDIGVMDEGKGTVVVVGADPTGLLLAGDLAAAGFAVTLVEKRAHGISNLSRALVVHARTLEQFDARGIADAPFADGYHRVVAWDRSRNVPDSEPLDLDEVKGIVRQALGRDFGMHDARWMSRFHSDERQAPAYRVGRVFLAGDAAHVHSTAGGQGMNTGLQDAANLSWKLIAAVEGRAPEGLLDTYEAERHPVGKAVLRSSGGLVRFAMAKRPWTRVARAVFATVVDRVGPVRARAVGRITGVGISYPAPRGAHRLVGRRVPDVVLSDGRLHELLRGGEFVLIAPRDVRFETGGAVPAHWSSARRTTLLVRPDGHVAWAAEEADAGAVGVALREWGV